MSTAIELNSAYGRIYRGQLRAELWASKRFLTICSFFLLSAELYLRPRGFRRSASLMSSGGFLFLCLKLGQLFKEVKEEARTQAAENWKSESYTGSLDDLSAEARSVVELLQRDDLLPGSSDELRRFYVARWFVCPESDRAGLSKLENAKDRFERCRDSYGEGDVPSVPEHVIRALLLRHKWVWTALGESYDGRRAVVAVQLARDYRSNVLYGYKKSGESVKPSDFQTSWLRKLSPQELDEGMRFLLAFGYPQE